MTPVASPYLDTSLIIRPSSERLDFDIESSGHTTSSVAENPFALPGYGYPSFEAQLSALKRVLSVGVIDAANKDWQAFIMKRDGAHKRLGRSAAPFGITNPDVTQTVADINEMSTWGTVDDDDDPFPDLSALDRAIAWVTESYELAISKNIAWTRPNVTLGSQGEVVLEWWHGDKALGIYISGDEAYFVRDWGADLRTEMEDGDAEPFDTRKSLFEWLQA